MRGEKASHAYLLRAAVSLLRLFLKPLLLGVRSPGLATVGARLNRRVIGCSSSCRLRGLLLGRIALLLRFRI